MNDTPPKAEFPRLGPIYRTMIVKERGAKRDAGFSRAADAYNRVKDYMRGLAHEEFWVLACDVKNRVVGSSMVSRGTLDVSIVHPRDVFRFAIVANAGSVMLIHNHPSGDPEPSPEDVALTRRLCEAGELLGISVLDHIVVGDQGFVSLAERGVV